MAQRSHSARLHHMIDAIADIRAMTAEAGANAIQNDRRTRLAMERAFEIISEASRHLPDELKARHPQIPWQKIASMGNVLRHEYQRVDLELLSKIASDNLPALEQTCRTELAPEQHPDSEPA
jgi:uncharacterized protein with HEPN domain